MYSQSSLITDSADKPLLREQPSPPAFSLPRIWPVAAQEEPRNRSGSKIGLVDADLDLFAALSLESFSPYSSTGSYSQEKSDNTGRIRQRIKQNSPKKENTGQGDEMRNEIDRIELRI